MVCDQYSILITGGAGFVGSHLCYLFLKKGFNIISLDSFVNSTYEVSNNIRNLLKYEKVNIENSFKFIKGDIKDTILLRKIFKEQLDINKPIKAVIHLAGLKSANESFKNPLKYWSNNVCGSINIFKVMEEFNCKIIVFSSSATIYGLTENKIINEKTKIKPINPYGNTKSTIETILNDIYFNSPNSWKIANLRYFNPIGAHPTGMLGENINDTPNNLFPYILQVALKKRNCLNVYGNDWPTKDGTGIRDYIHIMDLAKSHLLSFMNLLNSPPKIINLNIGTGKGTSVLELIRVFEEVNQCEIPWEFKSRRIGDVPICVADNSLCKKVLDWVPKKDIKTMCRDGWKWASSHPNGF